MWAASNLQLPGTEPTEACRGGSAGHRGGEQGLEGREYRAQPAVCVLRRLILVLPAWSLNCNTDPRKVVDWPLGLMHFPNTSVIYDLAPRLGDGAREHGPVEDLGGINKD